MSGKPETDFSVVIVTFNSQGEIVPCLQSVRRELKGTSGEIILIDNCSNDRTSEVVRAAAGSLEAATIHFELILNKENVGFTKALNQGLRACRGRYILALNPDTELQPACLQAMRGCLTADERIGMVAPQLLNPDGSVQPSCRQFPRRPDVLVEISGLSRLFPNSARFNRWKMGGFEHDSRRFVDQPQGACLLFPRAILDSVGLWDERFPMFFSDVDWCRRVKASGFEILFEPAAKVVHRKGASVRCNRARMIWTSHRSFYHYFKKHENKFSFVNEIFGAILLLTGIVRAGAAMLSSGFSKANK
ncbi:glycosyltransferase family 2 protein [candidate division KSB1 bacterium]|nr:glycosyltransferase family 2 protein [candidate division KSB1 bacterium]